MEHYYWFALRSVPYVGNVLFCRLIERFGTPEAALKATPEALMSIRGISRNLAEAISRHDYREAADRESARVAACGCKIIDCTSAGYPPLLREIADRPPYLYVQGNLIDADPAIAVVGSRRASSYGLLNTGRLAAELAAQGVAIVSGMARGVDAAAHQGALQQGGRTIGVLGCGVDVVYPQENRRLFAEMKEKAVLISEFPLGTLPLPENFPRRNRIISGLSRGVLVVEAAEGSGSLITAQYALEQGRDVFAIPGNINCHGSRGTNRLIKQGAKLVESVADILEELPQAVPNNLAAAPAPAGLAPEEAAILSLLAREPLHIDDVIASSALTVGEVSAILLRLELKGVISQLPGKLFTRG